MVRSLRDRVVPSSLRPAPKAPAQAAAGPRPESMTRGTLATTRDPASNPSAAPAPSTTATGVPLPSIAALGPLSANPTSAATAARSAPSLPTGPVTPSGSASPSSSSASRTSPSPTASDASVAAAGAVARAARGVGAAVSTASENAIASGALALPRRAGGGTGTTTRSGTPPSQGATAAAPGNSVAGVSAPESRSGQPSRGSAAGPVQPPASNAAANATQGLIIISLPVGSRVYVDGVLTRALVPASPARTILVAPGMHDIDVLTPAGASHKRRVTIDARDTVTLTIPK